MFHHYLRSGLLILGLVSAGTVAYAATWRAKIAEPVVEELMHGCSLRCAFPWRVEVQLQPGGKAQSIKMLNDESPQTAWIASQPGSGVGAKFRCVFPAKFPSGMDGETPLYGVNLINGRWQDEDAWNQYGRIKRARFWYNQKPLAEVTLPDSRRWLKTTFEDLMLRSGDSLSIEVLEIYPGSKFGLALTEIVLEGGH